MDGCTADCFLQVILQAARLSEVAMVAPLTQAFLQLRRSGFGGGVRWVTQWYHAPKSF